MKLKTFTIRCDVIGCDAAHVSRSSTMTESRDLARAAGWTTSDAPDGSRFDWCPGHTQL